LGLADARRGAAKAIREVQEGKDPGAAKVAQRGALRLNEPAVDRDLVSSVVEEFIRRAVRPHNRTAGETERIFNSYVLPAWGGRKVQAITRRDVLSLVDGIVDRGAPYAANRVFAAVRRFFNWTVERSILDLSPAAGMKPPGAEVKRDRVLTDNEIRLFWASTDQLRTPFRELYRLLLLTGQRRDEVAAMQWNEVEGADWTIPAGRVKNADTHLVPLSDLALETLRSVPQISGGPSFVFTTTGRSPVSGFSRAKHRLDALMKAESAGVELEPWRLHDLRRTCATGMARLRISPHVIEAVLNHRSGEISGVAAVYNRFGYLDEKRAALAAWERYVGELVDRRGVQRFLELS
jgi:integrase